MAVEIVAPRKRRWFQIHLSTAVVMMFAVGGFLWANLRPVRVEMNLTSRSLGRASVAQRTYIDLIGWPFWFGCRDSDSNKSYRIEELSLPVRGLGVAGYFYPYRTLILDAVLGLVGLLGVWLVCEWSIRLRAARKAA